MKIQIITKMIFPFTNPYSGLANYLVASTPLRIRFYHFKPLNQRQKRKRYRQTAFKKKT